MTAAVKPLMNAPELNFSVKVVSMSGAVNGLHHTPEPIQQQNGAKGKQRSEMGKENRQMNTTCRV
jgi:hypothetical protein